MDDFIYEYTNENIEEIVNSKYKFFIENIRNLQIFINDKRVGWKKYPLIDCKDGSYFHLITKNYHDKDGYCCPNIIIKCEKNFDYNPMMSSEYKEGEKRNICGHRIQCLYLIPEILKSKNTLIWSRVETTPKGKRTRIKFLDVKNKYIIIFDERNDGTILFWTSYPINDNKIERFISEYNTNKNNRINKVCIK